MTIRSFESEFLAQQAGQHFGRGGGGNFVGLDRGHGHVRGHDGVDAVSDRGFERFQLHGMHALLGRFKTRQAEMTVDIRVAMPGKMFRGDQHAILRIGMRAVDECGDVLRNVLRVLAERSNVDDRIRQDCCSHRRPARRAIARPGRGPRARCQAIRRAASRSRVAPKAMLYGNFAPAVTRMDAPRSKSAPTISGVLANLCI